MIIHLRGRPRCVILLLMMKIYQIFEYRRLTFVNVLYWWAAAVCLTRRSLQQHQSIMSWDAWGTSVRLPPTQQDITRFTRQGKQLWCKGKKKKWNMQKIQQIFFFVSHGWHWWTWIFFLPNTDVADWHGWFLHNKNIRLAFSIKKDNTDNIRQHCIRRNCPLLL